MSTVTATALADTLLSSILKLEASGLNWVIFSLCFQDAVKAKGYWGHFDGTNLHLIVIQTSPLSTSATTKTSATTTSPTAKELTVIAQWDKDE